MENINIGDKVRFLNDIGGGKVTGFRNGGIVLVEDEDGFEVPVMHNEVVVVESMAASSSQVEALKAATMGQSTIGHAKAQKPEREAPPTEEDIRIAELRELYKKEASQRKTEVITKPEENAEFASKVKSIGKAAANNKPIGNNKTAENATSTNVQDESFEDRVLRLELTVKRLQIRIERLEDAKALREKVKQEAHIQRETEQRHKNDIIEVDLHATEILESTAGMSPRDIKEYQLDVFRKTMKKHLSEKGRKIVFIHGSGDGVLRKAVIDELRHSYKKCEYQDASFQQYGFGATMVIIH